VRRAVLLVLVVVAACTPARREIRGDAVRRIRFVGNGGLFSGHDDSALRSSMVQRQSPLFTFTWPFTYFAEPAKLSTEALQADARRLEVWYAHHGWFDARFLGWELRRVRQRSDDRAGVVDVLGHVEPGEPSVFRRLALQGTWEPGVGAKVRAAWRDLPLRAGERFQLDEVQRASAAIVETLQDNGHAYASARPDVQAYPEEHQVDVTFDVDPGITAKFGEITIEGTRRLDPKLVRWRLGFDELDKYKLTTLRNARADLYRTELFSVVDVEPDLSDPSKELVPVHVKVAEAPFRRFRVLGGLWYNYYTLGPSFTLEFRDYHLFGSLLQMTARAGAGAVVGTVANANGGSTSLGTGGAPTLPTGLGELRFKYPWLGRGKIDLEFGASFKQDAQFGSLPYRQLDADILFAYRFSRTTTVSAGPVFQFFQYLSPSEAALRAAQLRFGGDFAGSEYRLLGFDAHFRVDWRDDPLRPRRGSFFGVDVRQSIPIPSFQQTSAAGGGDKGFLYTRLEGDLRGWWPVRVSRDQRRFPVVLAGRLHGIGLVPWRGDDDALPYPDLAFLGGPASLRSYRVNQVGPYDAICSYPQGRPNPQHNNGEPYNVNLTYVPRGGAFGAEAEAEVRYDLSTNVAVAFFGEGGILSHRWRTIGAEDLRAGGGVGLRYYSPIGPIRLDVGLRPIYPEDRGPQRWLGCNPVDQLPRGFDLLTGSRGVREELAARQFPLAINVLLAIGEPF
jgi:outer membrane protein assembly factor BamA